MDWRIPAGAVAVAVAAMALLTLAACRRTSGRWKPLIQDDASLEAALGAIAREHHQPAMGAAVILGDRIAARAVAGTGLQGAQQRVGAGSRFHIGSTTKTMTALLIAQLVKEGKLRYEATLGELLADIPMLPAYRAVTVRDLLLSKGGIIAWQTLEAEDPGVVKALGEAIPRAFPAGPAQRREVARRALALPPIHPPGTKNVYSNVGWSIAGHLAERASGAPYEELLRTRIFEPLGMTGARVGGWPASPEAPQQPRGHHPGRAGEAPRPQPLDDPYLLPAWMNPAGGVHCTIEDLARYGREQLLGLRGKGKLLDGEGYRAMHSMQDTVSPLEMYSPAAGKMKETYGTTPDPSARMHIGYAWAVVPLEEGMLSAADGSAGTFFARLVLFPPLDAAFVGFTNAGDGARALDAAINQISGLEWSSQ